MGAWSPERIGAEGRRRLERPLGRVGFRPLSLDIALTSLSIIRCSLKYGDMAMASAAGPCVLANLET